MKSQNMQVDLAFQMATEQTYSQRMRFALKKKRNKKQTYE